MIERVLIGASIAFASAFLSSILAAPAAQTGQYQLQIKWLAPDAISKDWEGIKSAMQIELAVEENAETELSEILGLLSGAAMSLGHVRSEAPEWTVEIVLHNKDMAFLSGGWPRSRDANLVVTIGLLELNEGTEAKAFVLAREMSHTLLKHADQRLSIFSTETPIKVQGASGEFELETGLANAGFFVFTEAFAPYTRSQIMKSNQLAVDLLHEAGYDVTASIEVLNRSAEASDSAYFDILHPQADVQYRMLLQYTTARGIIGP